MTFYFFSINIEGTFVFAKYLPKQPKSTSNFVGKGATSTLGTVNVVVECGGRCKKICPIILTSSCFAFTAVCKSPLQSTYSWKVGEGLRESSNFRNMVMQWNYSEREDVKFRRKLMSQLCNTHDIGPKWRGREWGEQVWYSSAEVYSQTWYFS